MADSIFPAMNVQDETDPLADPRIRTISERLRQRSGASPPIGEEHDDGEPLPPAVPFASVALVVRPAATDLEALLIRRAEFEGDPWSGHVALPGGRRAAGDSTPTDTAIRETREEVGIDLAASGVLLGRLGDVRPRRGGPLIAVSAHVFAVSPDTGVLLNHEVQAAFWVPLRHLMDGGSAIEHVHTTSTGEQVPFPAIGYHEYVIWGLTHRILSQFCEIISVEASGGSD